MDGLRWRRWNTIPGHRSAIERTCFTREAIPFRCVVDDAREYLETKVANGSLDIISMDAFDGGGNVPEHLISRAFFRLCGEKLKNNNNNQRSAVDVHHELFQRRERLDRERVCSRHLRSIGKIDRAGHDDSDSRSAV